MPNIKQKEVRMRTNEKSRQINAHNKSRVRTYYKAAWTAIQNGDADAQKKLSVATKELDKAVSKGTIKAGQADRRKSKLMTMQTNANKTKAKVKKVTE